MSLISSHKSSSQITLRGIPGNILRELKKEARRQNLSLNQVLLGRLLPFPGRRKEGACAELLDLAGTWKASRAGSFSKRLREIRKIDPELWPR